MYTGIALYGFRKMKSQHIEVLEAIDLLLRFITHNNNNTPTSTTPTSTTATSTTTATATHTATATLTPTTPLTTPIIRLNEQSLGLAVNGLQLLNCAKPQVKQLLVLLTNIIQHSTYNKFESTTLASVFYGIRSMSAPCKYTGAV